MDLLTITFYILGISILASFLGGLITRNYSHVDRLWSILPPVYVIVWMFNFARNPRFVIAAILVIIWGIRLSVNFSLKGGYDFSFKKGFTGEDYRWDILRKKIPNRILFEIFNLFFISFYQLALVFVITLPLYYYGKQIGPIMAIEYVLFCLHALLLIIETIADIQQFSYYKKRDNKKFRSNKKIKLGFNTFGLWKYSRHPNYVCEMGQWVVVYFYLHSTIGTYHWSGLGSLFLIFLFIGSSIMAETITKGKYPEYKEWQKATSPWLPFLDMIFKVKARKAFSKKYFK